MQQPAVGARVDAQAEGAGGLQRVDDVQVMRPAFGEILPVTGGLLLGLAETFTPARQTGPGRGAIAKGKTAKGKSGKAGRAAAGDAAAPAPKKHKRRR